MRGILYGIGVGPGDPELLTLKAKRRIEEADCLLIPVKESGEKSRAYEIVKSAFFLPEKPIVEVVFSMEKDRNEREKCRDRAAGQVMVLLDQGLNCAMITLGDVSIYSTYAYVHARILEKGYEAHMIPGIPSFCAGAAASGLPLMEGKESLAILPSLTGMTQVEQALELFDNVVVMKAGQRLADMEELLEAKSLLEHTTMFYQVGMEEEYIGGYEKGRDYGYFTTMLIKKKPQWKRGDV